MADLPTQLENALTDRYRLERELGRGGMATVFLAHDLRHDRPVALKVLHSELAATLGPDRFQREIKLAARLQHPHILSVFDSGEAAGQLWYTMPYVAGESLRDRLRRETQLGLDEALRLTDEVADALAYAHSQGVVHRDIKPENILLSRGHALVADFGIARAVDAAGDALTGTGLVIGTPAYMSPEQASGQHGGVDTRSDLYSLGCVLYEMLAGEPPYTGPTAQSILTKRLLDPVPDLRRARPNVPAPVADAVTRALATIPGDRFTSVAEFARRLQLGAVGPTTGPTISLPAATRGVGRRRSVPVAALTLGLGILLGSGLLFLWLPSHPAVGETGGAKLLAVLPFENLGAAGDEYFADGVTDDVRGRLATLPGLQVIARNSSTPYKKTMKTPPQIAQELGVRYLLTATVRWEKASGGVSRVHIIPELVEVTGGRAPRIKWQHPFEASLTDVFQVYADIGNRVAQALDVALGDSARQQLAEKPTENLTAYDAYLRGKEAWPTLFSSTPSMLHKAATYYEQAVALDSNFAEAWVRLSMAHAVLFANSSPTLAAAEQARHAAERARHLAPNRGDTHLALGFYFQEVVRDHVRAIDEFRQGRRMATTDTDLLNSAGYSEQSLGQWDSALVHFQRAELLDPRSLDSPRNLMQVLLHLRRYPQARAAADRALALAPTNLDIIEYKAQIALAQGDLAGARAVVAAAPKEVDRGALVAYFATYWDLYWVLDEAQQLFLLTLAPSAFDDNRSVWALVLAQTYSLRGDQTRARAYADSARIIFEQQLRLAPENADLHLFYGLSLAYLGRKADAVREGRLGVSYYPIKKDALNGPYLQHQLVRIYLLVGEPEKALDQLEPLLKIPYYLSPGWLKIDPNFDSLRGNPRFQLLVEDT